METPHRSSHGTSRTPGGTAPRRAHAQVKPAADSRALATLEDALQAQALRLGACERELAVLRAHLQQSAGPPPSPALSWRRISTRAVRALRRQTFAFDAEPVADLRRVGTDRTRYACTGPDPQLGLTYRGPRLPYGWVKLRAKFTHTADAPMSLRLYLDTGAGFNEADSQALPIRKGTAGHIAHIRFLPPNLQRLQLAPSAHGNAEFTLTDFSVQEMTKQEALGEMLLQAVVERRVPLQRWPDSAAKLVRKLRTVGIAGALNLLQHRGGQSNRLYADWVRQYDTLKPEDLTAMARQVETFAYRPRISLIMPVYNPPVTFLRQAIASVQAQVYADWQLCIADDASTDPEVGEVLRQAAAADRRIQVQFRTTQGHICAASNTALAMATGDFVSFLDHDDELRPHALYLVAHTLQAHPDAGLIYSDEDKIDATGQRHDPYFKSGWNPELLRSQNYINHLACYRRSLVTAAGNLREGFEGSQDYDLALRVTHALPPEQVHHIPHILYLWRSIPGSTAHTPVAKPYTFSAAHRALQDDVRRRQVQATVTQRPDGFFRTQYALPDPAPLVSIIVPTRDLVKLVRQCVDSILKLTTYPDYEILIVDNDSAQPATLAYFAEVIQNPKVRVVPFHQAFNYATLNNVAAAEAKGTVLCLLNNDIEVITPGWLDEMVSHALRPEVGAVGAKLYFPDRTIQHAGVVLGVGGIAGHAHKHLPAEDPGSFSRASLLQQYAGVTGACLVVRKALYEAVGGLDANLRVAYNDVDFCLRLLARGHRNVWTPYAELFHHESATRGADTTGEKLARVARESAIMRERWGALLDDDPFYNPNLTLSVEDFSLALPPRALRPWCD